MDKPIGDKNAFRDLSIRRESYNEDHDYDTLKIRQGEND